MSIENLPFTDGPVQLHHFRIDARHSNSFEVWKKLGSPQQPSAEQYAQLEKAGQLTEFHPAKEMAIKDAKGSISFHASTPGRLFTDSRAVNRPMISGKAAAASRPGWSGSPLCQLALRLAADLRSRSRPLSHAILRRSRPTPPVSGQKSAGAGDAEERAPRFRHRGDCQTPTIHHAGFIIDIVLDK